MPRSLATCTSDAARDGGQNRVGVRLRHNERAIGLDEQHVCSAGFLNIGARLGIKVQVLSIALADALP